MEGDLYVLVCERDTGIERDDGRPIVFEQYIDDGVASLENVTAFQKRLGDKYGKTRIAKLQFVDTSQDKKPRVLVVVSGGIADPVYDSGVDVEVFDWDNYKDDPEGTGGVPRHFADLAEPIDVPVGGGDNV